MMDRSFVEASSVSRGMIYVVSLKDDQIDRGQKKKKRTASIDRRVMESLMILLWLENECHLRGLIDDVRYIVHANGCSAITDLFKTTWMQFGSHRPSRLSKRAHTVGGKHFTGVYFALHMIACSLNENRGTCGLFVFT